MTFNHPKHNVNTEIGTVSYHLSIGATPSTITLPSSYYQIAIVCGTKGIYDELSSTRT